MQERTKIAYIITKGVWGGAQSYVFDLAKNIDKTEYDVFVISGEGKELEEKLLKEDIKIFKVSSMQRDIRFLKELVSLKKLYQILKTQKPDIIHLNSSKAGIYGGILGRFLGIKKIIFTLHGLASNENRSKIQKILFYSIHILTILLCHKTIAVSDKTKKDINLTFIRNKIVVIKNGISNFYTEDRENARNFIKSKIREKENRKINENSLWIGTVSELHKNKGLDIAISGLSKIKNTDFHFFIIGGGNERKSLENLTEKMGIKEKVFFLGQIDSAKKYLKAFDIFTLTSRTEAMPYAILEAGISGLPIIASMVGGIPEIIENGWDGITIYPEKEKFSNALVYMIEHPEKRKVFSENIKQKILKDFSIENMLEKTYSMYKLDNTNHLI